MFSAVGLFLGLKSKILNEQNVIYFQFYIRLPNFRLLGSIIKIKSLSWSIPLSILYRLFFETQGRKHGRNLIKLVMIQFNSLYINTSNNYLYFLCNIHPFNSILCILNSSQREKSLPVLLMFISHTMSDMKQLFTADKINQTKTFHDTHRLFIFYIFSSILFISNIMRITK